MDAVPFRLDGPFAVNGFAQGIYGTPKHGFADRNADGAASIFYRLTNVGY